MFRTLLFLIGLWSQVTFAQQTTLFINATILHPHLNERVENGYLLVQDGRLVSVGKTLPDIQSSHSVVDLQNKYIVAGFIDTHAHISLGAVSYEVNDQSVSFLADNSIEVAKWNAKRLVEWGVTTIRNPGGDTHSNLAYKQSQAEGAIIGPRAFVAGAIINTEPFDGLVAHVQDDNSIANVIEEQAGLGVDYIKLYTGLDKSQLAMAASQAKKHNLPVIAHVEDVSWTQAAKSGVDNLVHAMPISDDLLVGEDKQDYIDSHRPGSFGWFEWYKKIDLDSAPIREMINELLRYDVSVDPTMVVFHHAFFGNQKSVTQTPELDDVYPELLENWRTFYHFNIGWTEQDYAQAAHIWPKVLQFVKLLYDNQIQLSIGTDLGNPWVVPGVSFHQEMQLMQDAGLSPMQILDLATRGGAQVIGQQHQLGTLESGKLADFVVFNQDPSISLENAKDISAVYQSGKRVR